MKEAPGEALASFTRFVEGMSFEIAIASTVEAATTVANAGAKARSRREAISVKS